MSKLYERLSSLTPLLQGKQVNYLPMLLGALKNQGIEDVRIKEMIESFIAKMPVGDLGEKLYPRSTFDEYYIHKTNFYLGQLKQKSFDELFQKLIKEETDFGASYEFAGIVRLMYALKSEEHLALAEALAFFDLTSMKKNIEVTEIITYEQCVSDLQKRYEDGPSRKNLVTLMNALALKNLGNYLGDVTKVISRYHALVDDVEAAQHEPYPTLKEIKERDINSLDDLLLMIMHDLLQDS